MSAKPEIIFITGTDTGVGKTIVTCLLLAHLRRKGFPALALKPFCSGGRADAELLRTLQDDELTLNETNPFYFSEPIAPLVAAREQGRKITFQEVINRIEGIIKKPETHNSKTPSLHYSPRRFLLIEGAGGLFSPLGVRPLNWQKNKRAKHSKNLGKTSVFSALDLIKHLRCRVIVVAANKLGTINHTLLTVTALQMVVRKHVTVLLSNAVNPKKSLRTKNRQTTSGYDLSCAKNGKIISELLFPVRVIEIPHFGEVSESLGFTERFTRLKKICKKNEKTLAKILR